MSSWHSKRPQSSLKLNFNVFIDTSYDISKHMGYKLLPCTPCVYSNPHIKTNSAFPDDFISFCWLTCPCLLKLLLRVFFQYSTLLKHKTRYLQISYTFETFRIHFYGHHMAKTLLFNFPSRPVTCDMGFPCSSPAVNSAPAAGLGVRTAAKTWPSDGWLQELSPDAAARPEEVFLRSPCARGGRKLQQGKVFGARTLAR